MQVGVVKDVRGRDNDSDIALSGNYFPQSVS